MTMKFATYAKIMKEAAGDPPAPPAGAMPPGGAPPAGGAPPDLGGAAGAPPMGAGAPPPMPGDPAAGGMPPMPGDPAAAGAGAKPVNIKTHNVWDVLKTYLHKLKSGDDSGDKKKKADQNV